MKKLTDRQTLEVFKKAGYSVHRIGKKYEVCTTLDKLMKERNLILSCYLHIFDCCANCKKKVYRQRYKIKKKKKW